MLDLIVRAARKTLIREMPVHGVSASSEEDGRAARSTEAAAAAAVTLTGVIDVMSRWLLTTPVA